MTRPVRAAPATESSRAWTAFTHYRDMPPGQRSLANLIARYRSQSATEGTPPTKRLDTLKTWSQTFGWVARVALHDAEQDAIRKEQQRRVVQEQAAADATLARQVGSGGLAVAALILHDLVDPKTGQLRRPASARDLGPVVRASLDCLSYAHGGSAAEDGSDPGAAVEKVLQHAPDDVRTTVCRGLRALQEWREQHEGRR